MQFPHIGKHCGGSTSGLLHLRSRSTKYVAATYPFGAETREIAHRAVGAACGQHILRSKQAQPEGSVVQYNQQPVSLALWTLEC